MHPADLGWRRVFAEQLRTRARIERLAFVLDVKFDPNQPRKPAGQRDGGQWMKIDGPVLAQARPPPRSPNLGSGGASRPIARTPRDAVPVPRRTDAEIMRTPTSEMYAPGGREIGYRPRGVGEGIQTLERDQFRELERQMRLGSTLGRPRGTYDGLVLRRWDGAEFGIRNSDPHGPTIDIFTPRGSGRPLVERIHQR
jgi:hypothetical protein